MDTTPQMNSVPQAPAQQAPEHAGHKGIAILFILVVLVALGLLGYWMMTTKPPQKNTGVESALSPSSQRVDDSSATIEQELNAVNVNSVDLDAEIQSTDGDLQQL